MSETTPKVHDRYLLTALVQTEAAFDELVSYLKNAPITIEKTENMGPRQLSFPINKHRELLLTSVFFRAESNLIAELEQGLKHEEAVERYLLTTWKGDLEAPKRSFNRDHRAAKKEEAHV